MKKTYFPKEDGQAYKKVQWSMLFFLYPWPVFFQQVHYIFLVLLTSFSLSFCETCENTETLCVCVCVCVWMILYWHVGTLRLCVCVCVCVDDIILCVDDIILSLLLNAKGQDRPYLKSVIWVKAYHSWKPFSFDV